MSDTEYSRLAYVFNDMAWGDDEPSDTGYGKACAELNALITRDFPELTHEDLWALRTQIENEKERVKRLLGLD